MALFTVSSWIPGTEAANSTKEVSYSEDDDKSQVTMMAGNTASTEHYVSASDRNDETNGDYLENESQNEDSMDSAIVSDSANNETENIPKSSPLTAESSHLGYRMPGLFGFNGGQPFYLEKDPITGAVDFSTKTSSVRIGSNKDPDTGGPSLQNHKISEASSTSDDYYYDDDDDNEDSDNIDRIDSALDDNGRPNNMNHYKNYPPIINDVNIHVDDHSNHKYQGEHNNKFPLISSSYANTKVQGTASGLNRNHRPYVTSSTQPPSYYTIRPHPTFTSSTSQPPTRSTSKNKPSQNNNSHHPLATAETIYYRPTTEKHNTHILSSQHTSHQTLHEGYELTLLEKQQQNQDHERYDDRHQDTKIQKQAPQDQQKKLQPFNHPSPPDNNSIQILTMKSTEQPTSYEDDNNEDYDTEEPTTFNLSELFGYGKPPAETMEEKSQQGQKLKVEEHFKQDENEKPLLLTSQPTHTSNTTRTSIIKHELNSEGQKYATQKNHTQQKLHSTQKPIVNKFSNTQTPGIIYNEPNTVKHQNSGTSFLLDTQSHSKQQSANHLPEKYQPSLNLHSGNYQQGTFQTAAYNPNTNANTNIPVIPSAHKQLPEYFVGSEHVESNTLKGSPYGSYAEEPFRPIFGPGKVEDRPPSYHPDHQPLAAPPNNDKNTNSIPVTNLSPVKGEDVQSSKVPQETPTRWNYPYNEGTSTFFQLPPPNNLHQLQQQQAQKTISAGNSPRIPGAEPPRPNSQKLPFVNLHSQQHKPIHTSEMSVSPGGLAPNQSRLQSNDLQRPVGSQMQVIKPEWIDSNAKRKGDAEGYVVFPDSYLAGELPGNERFETPSIAVPVSTNIESIVNEEGNYQLLPPQSQPQQEEVGSFEITHTSNEQRISVPPSSATRPINQNGPPISDRNTVEEPAQELRPPTEPATLRPHSVSGNYPRPHWESRPTVQPSYFPQPDSSQIARPKHDAIPPHFGQNSPNFGTGYRVRPGFSAEHSFQGNRPQPIQKNRNQNPNLPNILPQFRPNAKISHVHTENGGRIQAYPHFGLQRQPLLERPGRHPLPELMGQLHPPPPPNHRRVNRNDSPGPLDGLNKVEGIFPFEKYPPQSQTFAQQRPLVHRRTGPHITDVGVPQPQIATLQMMQHQQQGANTYFLPRQQVARDDFPESNDEMKPPFEVKYPLGSTLSAETPQNQPVFVVYPVNSTPLNGGGSSSNNGGVVVGIHGPQRPLPPTNLDSESSLSLSSEDDSSLTLPFPGHKNQKPVLQLPTDMLHSSPLQSQNAASSATPNANAERPIKSDFPYALERPTVFTDVVETEMKQDNESHKEILSIMTGVTPNNNDRYDNEFEPAGDEIPAEVHNSNSDSQNEDDTEINIIPYLQDYMPFATKKPITSVKPSSERNPATLASVSAPLGSYISSIKPEKDVVHGNQWTTSGSGQETQDARIVKTESAENQVHGSASPTLNPLPSSPISVVLRTVQPQSSTTHSPIIQSTLPATGYPKASPLSVTNSNVYGSSSQLGHQQGLVGSAGSEFTVSAVMHTHPQAASNHRPAELFSSTPPPQLNFQAPFLASANIGVAPTNQGWSVVGGGGPSNERMKPGTVDKADIHGEELETSDIRPSSKDENQGNEPNNFDFENFRPQLFGGFKPIYTFPEENGEEHSKYLQTTERQEKMMS
jgi:hypothetical protein